MNNTYLLPSISIIIPVFKVKDYIIECIQSVANQDYKGEIECILVDDRGEDGSIELCEKFITHNKSKVSFIILHNERNIKQSASRNAGMKVAKGDYIYFLDSDDWILPSTLSTMVEILKKYPNCELIQAGISCTIPNIYDWLDCNSWKDHEIEYCDDRDWIINTCAGRFDMIPMTPVSKLMSREFIDNNNFKFIEGIFHEDEVWLVLFAKYLKNVAFCHCNPYIYRIRTNSTTGGGQIKHYYDWLVVWSEIFKLFDSNFCPQRILFQIEVDTSKYYHETTDKKIRKKLIETKIKLSKYCKWKRKIHIYLWILIFSYKSLITFKSVR